MAATIQTIQTPKRARALDTSGNNNHGQIYSGRGLEFDGVSDYLSGASSFPHSNTTVVLWINQDNATSEYRGLVGRNTGSAQLSNWAVWWSGGQIKSFIGDGSSYDTISSNATLENSTWYRIVVTFDFDNKTAKTYINGYLDDTHIWTRSHNTDTDAIIIGSLTSSSSFWVGKMSDVQLWDTVWTQADVTYDYLNPEQLALNRGGTSLTESNLKVWYPMQDGHRGQQSFILDGSNVGVGEEMISNGDFSVTGDWAYQTGWAYDTDKATFTAGGSDNGLRIIVGDMISAIEVSTTYKLVFTISTATAEFSFYDYGNSTLFIAKTTYAVGTHTLYFNTPSSIASGGISFYAESDGNTFSIDDISVKPVNAKNHATTVFYGDDLWDDADNYVSSWADQSGSAEVASADCIKLTPGTLAAGSKIDLNNTVDGSLTEDLTIGRTYRLTAQCATDVVGAQSSFGIYNGTSWTWATEGQHVTATNIMSDGDFEAGSSSGTSRVFTSWTQTDSGAGDIEEETSSHHNGTRSVKLTTASSATVEISQTEAGLTAGDKYLLTYWSKGDGSVGLRHQVYDNTGSANIIATANDNSGNTTANWAQTAVQFTLPTSCVSVRIKFLSPHANGVAYVDDVVLTKFLDKTIDYVATHATTNHLSQQDARSAEHIVAVNDRNSLFDEAGQWIAYNESASEASVSISGAKLSVVTGTTELEQGAQLPVANFTALQVGRTYVVVADLDAASGTPTVKVDLGGSTAATSAISTTETSYKFSVTPANITGNLRIYTDDTGGIDFTIDNVQIFAQENMWIDNIAFKEVGTATGWTDADQQLDIPQTALQSYNQLAWFDGVADIVSCGTDSNLAFGNNNFTMSAWINIADYKQTLNYVVAIGNSAEGEQCGIGVTSSNTLFCSAYSSPIVTTTATVSTGQWMHLVMVYTGGATDEAAFYVNGSPFETESIALNVTTGKIRIGCHVSDGSFWCGSINEVSIFSSALTLAEVQELFNDGKALDATTHSAESNLKGYWRNNGLATWADRQDNITANNGTPTSLTDTILIPAGVDGSRDNQGFLMNRQKDTNALNLTESSSYLDYIDYVDLVDEIDLGTSCTISFWAKRHNTGTLEMVIGNDTSYVIYFNAATSVIARIDDTNNLTFDVADVATALARTDWVFWTFVRDSSTGGKLYVDGILEDSDTNGSISGTTAISKIGSDEDSQYTFEGAIDDVTLYSTALDATQILRNYNAGKRSHR